jgi:UDP-N-acetylmuramoylalanine--D-glutamate ligase
MSFYYLIFIVKYYCYVLYGRLYENNLIFIIWDGGIQLKNDFNQFKKYIKGKKVVVIGIGVSNTPLIRMLVDLGAIVTACDKRADIGELYKEFSELGVDLKLGENYLDSILNCEVIFRTPSMLPTNSVLKKAIEKGIYVTSEIAEFIKYCPCKVFGITGSDGKSTTTTLIGEMLKRQGYRVYVGGNLGTPLFSELDNIRSEDYAVVELSSFQLMDINNSTDISVITNISPNHLDIHRDMEEYVEAKKKVFINQGLEDLIILNRDNELTFSMKGEAKGKVRTFSLKDKNSYSYLDGTNLICNDKVICNIDEVKLLGMHMIENILTAFSAVNDYVSLESMRFVATTFRGVEHRLEFVRELRSVKFYNDSIASSPSRALAGLSSFKQKVILIAGGADKKIPFDQLAVDGIDRIKILVLMGNTKEKIKEAFEIELKRRNITLPIILTDSLEAAVESAYEHSESNDIITLSPACTSFDRFKNFEERGNLFKELVNNLK